MAPPNTGAGGPGGLPYTAAPASAPPADPELQKLLTRQQALTEQIDDLRRRQPTMAAAEYTAQLEALLIQLAEVSRDVRRRQGN